MRNSRLLPAGVPPGIARLRDHIAAFLAGAPVLFIAVVLGVALTFRVAIGAVRPAVAAEEPAPAFAAEPAPPQAAAPEARPAGVGPAAPTGSQPSQAPRPGMAGRGKARNHGRR